MKEKKKFHIVSIQTPTGTPFIHRVDFNFVPGASKPLTIDVIYLDGSKQDFKLMDGIENETS